MNSSIYFIIFCLVIVSVIALLTHTPVGRDLEYYEIAYATQLCNEAEADVSRIIVGAASSEVICNNKMSFSFTWNDAFRLGPPDNRAMKRLAKQLKKKEAQEKLEKEQEKLEKEIDIILNEIRKRGRNEINQQAI